MNQWQIGKPDEGRWCRLKRFSFSSPTAVFLLHFISSRVLLRFFSYYFIFNTPHLYPNVY